jgi:hypothetical protein
VLSEFVQMYSLSADMALASSSLTHLGVDNRRSTHVIHSLTYSCQVMSSFGVNPWDGRINWISLVENASELEWSRQNGERCLWRLTVRIHQVRRRLDGGKHNSPVTIV